MGITMRKASWYDELQKFSLSRKLGSTNNTIIRMRTTHVENDEIRRRILASFCSVFGRLSGLYAIPCILVDNYDVIKLCLWIVLFHHLIIKPLGNTEKIDGYPTVFILHHRAVANGQCNAFHKALPCSLDAWCT